MRYELSDYEWTAIKPMLPSKPRGVRRVNDRRVLNSREKEAAREDHYAWGSCSKAATGVIPIVFETGDPIKPRRMMI
jgi:transposase